MGPSRIGKDNPPAPEEFCSPRHRRVRHGCPVSPRQIGVDRKDGHVHPTSKLAFRCLPRGHQRGNLGSELLMWQAAHKARYAAQKKCLNGRKHVEGPHLSLRLVAQQQLPCIFQLGFSVRQDMKREQRSRASHSIPASHPSCDLCMQAAVCGLKRIWCQPVVKRAACTRRDLKSCRS